MLPDSRYSDGTGLLFLRSLIEPNFDGEVLLLLAGLFLAVIA